VYEEEGVEQLLFEVDGADGTEIVAYSECAFEITGSDNWMNESFFTRRDMRPMFVEELAVHPGYHGRGVGSLALEQLEHLRDDLAYAHRPVEHRSRGRQRHSLSARRDQHRRHAFHEAPKAAPKVHDAHGAPEVSVSEMMSRRIAHQFTICFEHHDGRHLAARECAASFLCRVHAQRVNPALAQFGADRRAQPPISREHVDDWHPEIRIAHLFEVCLQVCLDV
jgi:GNAT superfamily N-acetyltransferase